MAGGLLPAMTPHHRALRNESARAQGFASTVRVYLARVGAAQVGFFGGGAARI